MKLNEMKANELIKLFSRLERIKQKEEDTFAGVYDGRSYCCNTHRADAPYVIDGESVTAEDFFYLQEMVKIALVVNYGVDIIARPPHKRNPKKRGMSEEFLGGAL